MTARRIDFDWNHVQAFLAVAEHGSYSGAAVALGVAQPTVGRQIAALEEELGLTLVQRAGRAIALTPTGVELVEHVKVMYDAALRVARVAAGQSIALDGRVSISASEIVASHFLPPAIAELRASHPGIEIDLIASNASQDLRRREADIALRNYKPKEPELVARKLRESEAYLYGAPAYLQTLGKKRTLESLSRATFINFDRSDTLREGLAALGLPLSPANFAIASASQHAQWALVRHGVGIGIMIAEVGDNDPLVERATDALPAIVVPLWLVTHRDVDTSRRVRVVADALIKHLNTPAPSAAKKRGVEWKRPTKPARRGR